MKKIKKLTAMLLTLVMSLALAVPCFAAAPAEDAIWLEVGDSCTVGGYTITIKEDTRTPEERAAERRAVLLARGQMINGRYYFLKAEEYQHPMVDYVADCQSTYGDTLCYNVDNYQYPGSTTLTLTLQVRGETPVYVNVSPGQSIFQEVYADKGVGLHTPVTSSIDADAQMWYAVSIYQYWR